MTRTILFATGFALAGAVAASTIAFAQDVNTLKSVEVKAELGDINNANALDYWPSIEEDLAKVIEAEAAPNVSENGYQVVVSLKEVSLSGSKLLSGRGEFNHLEGWVYFIPEGETVAQDQDDVIIEAVTAPVPNDAIAVIVPGKPAFYAAMLEGFAVSTVDKLEALDSTPVRSTDQTNSESN